MTCAAASPVRNCVDSDLRPDDLADFAAPPARSHGPRLTAILEGIPAGPADRSRRSSTGELARRQHGYGRGGRMKIEKDEALFEGGVRGGVTLGSPIAIGIENRDFANWEGVMGPLEIDPRRGRAKRLTRPRPGHADLAGGMKYGAKDLRDVLERASARESAARVAAGAVCKLLLASAASRCASGVLSLGAVVDDAVAALLRVAREGPRGLAAARARRDAREEDGRGRRRGEEGGRHARRRDPRRRARRAGGPRARYVSWDRKLDGRIGAGAALDPRRQGGRARLGDRGLARSRLARPRRDRAGAGRRSAPPHQPRRRPRGGRDQRRGRHRGRRT